MNYQSGNGYEGQHDALMAAFGNLSGGMNQLNHGGLGMNQLAYYAKEQGDALRLYGNALQNMLAVTPAETKLNQAKNYVKEHGHNPGVLERWMRSRGK